MALDRGSAAETPNGSGRAFETAIAHVSANVPIGQRNTTIGELRESLIGKTFDSATHVVVRDGDRFVGIARIEDVLRAPVTDRLDAVMDADPPIVAPGVDQEVAAWRAVQRGESALSVVEAGGRFVGLIAPDRLLAVLLAEHEEDISRLGGFLKGTSTAVRSTEEPLDRRFRHRMPWLLLGLLGAIVSADMMASFEARMQQHLVLAFFIPGIVYLADAVGTQTETVVVRGMSVGVPMRRIFILELLTGVLVGLALALIALPVLWWRWVDFRLALGVATAIFAACSIATLVAMVLPWLLDRAGADPAFGSGPLATVIQDLLSILIYFAVVTALL